MKGEGEDPHTWAKMIDCLTAIGALEAVGAIREHLFAGSCASGSPGISDNTSSISEDISRVCGASEDSTQVGGEMSLVPEVQELQQPTHLDTTQAHPQPCLFSGGMDPNPSCMVMSNPAIESVLPVQGSGAFIQMQSSVNKHFNYTIAMHKPRRYQLELATPGMQGKNCIVCAPTGTGKTFVAALIVSNHLNQRQGKGKVVFVVPTQPLAKQQQKSIKESIPLARVACCVGDDTGGSVRMAITDNEIVVCTAGKLWDELQEMNDRSLKFTHFSLMVIDECHNARKSSPQANVMTKYLKEKLIENNVNLPLVLGLTASPGAGDKRVPTLDSTYDYLISLCALMDATEGIVSVKSNKDELEQHTKKSTSILKHYPGRDANEMLIQEVLKVMKMWEKEIDLRTIYKPWEQRYETEIQKIKKTLESSQVPMRDKFSILEYLLCLAEALSVYMKLRHEDAIEILNDFVMHCSNESAGGAEHRIVTSLETLKETLSSLDPVPNPLLEKVKEELVSRRKWFVGHTAETGRGMTDPEKEEALAGFREGRYNILVATSVLEEGIDVPACNLVIRYEHVTNEIAKVQAEGRARAENSEGITIVSSASNKMFKELLNEEKDQIVKEAMEYLPSGDDGLVQIIKEKQLQIVKKTEMKKRLEEEKHQSVNSHDREKVTLKCKKCKNEVCRGSDLYTLQIGGCDVSVFNKSFMEEKAKKKPHPHPRQGKEGFSAAKEKIHCIVCEADWGVVGIWSSKEFPLLKCKSFNYEMQGIPIALSQWSHAPFKIPPAAFAHPDYQNIQTTEDDDQGSII
eukprot:Em0039g35a